MESFFSVIWIVSHALCSRLRLVNIGSLRGQDIVICGEADLRHDFVEWWSRSGGSCGLFLLQFLMFLCLTKMFLFCSILDLAVVFVKFESSPYEHVGFFQTLCVLPTYQRHGRGSRVNVGSYRKLVRGSDWSVR